MPEPMQRARARLPGRAFGRPLAEPEAPPQDAIWSPTIGGLARNRPDLIQIQQQRNELTAQQNHLLQEQVQLLREQNDLLARQVELLSPIVGALTHASPTNPDEPEPDPAERETVEEPQPEPPAEEPHEAPIEVVEPPADTTPSI